MNLRRFEPPDPTDDVRMRDKARWLRTHTDVNAFVLEYLRSFKEVVMETSGNRHESPQGSSSHS
jgi:hypothetical protein